MYQYDAVKKRMIPFKKNVNHFHTSSMQSFTKELLISEYIFSETIQFRLNISETFFVV